MCLTHRRASHKVSRTRGRRYIMLYSAAVYQLKVVVSVSYSVTTAKATMTRQRGDTPSETFSNHLGGRLTKTRIFQRVRLWEKHLQTTIKWARLEELMVAPVSVSFRVGYTDGSAGITGCAQALLQHRTHVAAGCQRFTFLHQYSHAVHGIRVIHP